MLKILIYFLGYGFIIYVGLKAIKEGWEYKKEGG